MLAAAALLGPPALAEGRWGGSVALASDYVHRGVSMSGRAAALQADLHWRSPQGWFVGAWLSTTDPPPGRIGRYELDLYAGRGWSLGERWAAAFRYVRYRYPDSRYGARHDWDEGSAALAFDDRLVLGVAGSPNASRYSSQGFGARRRTLSYEASLRQPLGRGMAIVAAVGHYDTRDLFGTSYRAWNAGLSAQLGPLDATLTRFGTDAAARRLFGRDGADRRWVLGAVWRF